MTRHSLVWVIALLLDQPCTPASAQTDSTVRKRGPYAVVLTAGGGLSYYLASVGIPPGLEQPDARRLGVPVTFRAMWYPDHRLRVGLETGLVPMYSYRATVSQATVSQAIATGERARVAVSAVPILLVFSMPLAWLSGTERSLARRLAVAGGTGAYVVNSRLDYAGTAGSSRLNIGWMLAGSYVQPVGRRFRVAAEVKRYTVTATKDAAFAVQLQVVWRAFSW